MGPITLNLKTHLLELRMPCPSCSARTVLWSRTTDGIVLQWEDPEWGQLWIVCWESYVHIR